MKNNATDDEVEKIIQAYELRFVVPLQISIIMKKYSTELIIKVLKIFLEDFFNSSNKTKYLKDKRLIEECINYRKTENKEER